MSFPDFWIGVQKGWQHSGNDLALEMISLNDRDLQTHAYVIGATGSGKTTLIHSMMNADLGRGHSIIVIDLLGDLANAAIELCKGHVDPAKLKIIDLREKVRPFGYNPLAGAGEPYYRALAVLDAVESESDSWGVQIAESARNALMLLGEAGSPLTRLEDVFYDRKFRNDCLSSCSEEAVLKFWERYDSFSPDRQSSLAMPVLNKFSLLTSTKTLRRILGHPEPIDLGAHLNEPGSVLLVALAADELHGASRMMGNLIVASVVREIYSRVNIPQDQRNPVRLYVDEFEAFNIGPFEDIAAQGRRFGLTWVLAHQSLAQLAPRVRSILLNIVGLKVVLRVGRDDSLHMSRDLFGDPKAFDFTGLAVGDAILWRRNQDPLIIEINEPMIRSGNYRSRESQEYLREVYAFAGDPEAHNDDVPHHTDHAEVEESRNRLDEWL